MVGLRKPLSGETMCCLARMSSQKVKAGGSSRLAGPTLHQRESSGLTPVSVTREIIRGRRMVGVLGFEKAHTPGERHSQKQRS